MTDDIVLDDEKKQIIFRQRFKSTIPKIYEAIKNTLPEERTHKLVTILGIESLNELEDYTKYYNIKPGDIVVDAGAHVGMNTQLFSKAVGDKGLVLAIEPDYRALGMLVHNTAELTNVKILPYALWNCNDIMPLQYLNATDGIGVSSMIYQFQYWHPVRAITLDNLLKQLKIEKVNFIKMDIEGSECYALSGANETLNRVDALAIASYHRINNEGDKSFKDVLSMLEAKGFITRLEQGHDGELVFANR